MIAATRKAAALAAVLLTAASALPSPASARDLVMEHIQKKVISEITRCLQPPKGVSPPYPTVTLLLNFKPDGILNGPPQLASPPAGDPGATAYTMAVLRAASRCVRLDDFFNYKRDYMRWRSVRVLYDPALAR